MSMLSHWDEGGESSPDMRGFFLPLLSLLRFDRLVTAAEFLSAMHGWVDEFAGNPRNKGPAGIAIHGKTMRGSFVKAAVKLRF